MNRQRTYRRLLSLTAPAALLIPTGVRANDFDLGAAGLYGMIAGPNTTSVQFSNSIIHANVATDVPGTTAGSNYVEMSGGTIDGNFSFAGTAQSNLGAVAMSGTKISNDALVTSAYNTVFNLSNTFAGEPGAPLGSGTVNASSGILDSTGNRVFTTTASSFLSSPLTINGGPNDYVVINVTGQNNVQLKNTLSLTGGITSDHVFINITGTGQQVLGNTTGGTVNGVFVALNDAINIVNTTINGRVIGGSNANFSLVNGVELNSPVVVPEPASVVTFVIGGGLLVGVAAYGRRRSRTESATTSLTGGEDGQHPAG
jgi:hypothetical protein